MKTKEEEILRLRQENENLRKQLENMNKKQETDRITSREPKQGDIQTGQIIKIIEEKMKRDSRQYKRMSRK